ncbi:MAG: GMC family oxidoreductase [Holophagaceae bacterium]|nr:GMC family oxidoreductase [Holophagaceae bacterium]
MSRTIHTDVLVLGSGAGGGTVAQTLAPLVASGKRVLLVEKGGRVDHGRLSGREVECAALFYAGGGARPSADHTVSMAYAEGLGGSTQVYTGTSLPPPERIISGWRVPGLAHADLAARARRFAAQNGADFIPRDRINDNNRLFKEGCEALGWKAEQFPINVRGCKGSSLCNLGCPNNAKQGTRQVQIPEAQRQGVEVVTRAEAWTIKADGGGAEVEVRVDGAPHADGSEGEWLPGRYTVKAHSVVVACGAVNSPALLLRSGLGAELPALGRWWTCHPAHILAGLHPHPITNFVGHPKSYVWQERVEAERYFLEACMYFPFTTAKNLTGFGEAHERLMRAYDRLQMILVLACDEALPEQRIDIDRQGRPVIRYALTAKTLEAMVRATRAAARIFFAAGAEAVHAPSARPTLIERSEGADLEARIALRHFRPGSVSVSAAHLMGGCRMGVDSAASVTDGRGRVHRHPWLFVADASLFPSALEINPYLTVMALADRVGEAVAEREGASLPVGA